VDTSGHRSNLRGMRSRGLGGARSRSARRPSARGSSPEGDPDDPTARPCVHTERLRRVVSHFVKGNDRAAELLVRVGATATLPAGDVD
jgi:hypothetical protein